RRPDQPSARSRTREAARQVGLLLGQLRYLRLDHFQLPLRIEQARPQPRRPIEIRDLEQQPVRPLLQVDAEPLVFDRQLPPRYFLAVDPQLDALMSGELQGCLPGTR